MYTVFWFHKQNEFEKSHKEVTKSVGINVFLTIFA
jgi:hypothetical protein